jgi:hypothetical protein
MSFLPLLLIWLASKPAAQAVSTTQAAPKWPNKRHPPPRRPKRTLHAVKSAPAHAAPKQEDAAAHAAPLAETPAEAPAPSAAESPAAPAPIPPMPSPTPTSDLPADLRVSVANAQAIIHSLGGVLGPHGRDGLYGPATKAAWGKAARKRGLDPEFTRLGPREVRVHRQTYAALAKGAHVVGQRVYIP